MDSTEALVEALGSADQDERAQALAGLVAAGPTATGPLVTALSRADPGVRRQAAQALAEIGDPSAAQAFADLLQDEDGSVRARGAQGLARIGAPAAVDALVRTIDDLPDLLHYPFTMSVRALIDLGWAAVAAPVSQLLKAADPATRQRAFLVLRSLADDPAAGPAVAEAMSRYDADAGEAERTPVAEEIIHLIAP